MGKHRLGSAEGQWGGPELVVDAEAAIDRAATRPLPVIEEQSRSGDPDMD